MTNKVNPPVTEIELLARSHAISGMSLAELAAQLSLPVPADLKKMKGWVGQLLEHALGADAGSLPVPDFQLLDIELKTIPIDKQGRPMQSTYVTVVPLSNTLGLSWETSECRAKLEKVLWVPIESAQDIPLPDRRIGTPILWRLTPEQEAILKQDWEELMDMVSLGQLEQVTARYGEYLQIRPKGADAKALSWGRAPGGEKILTLPRGFYLRPIFAESILKKSFPLTS